MFKLTLFVLMLAAVGCNRGMTKVEKGEKYVVSYFVQYSIPLCEYKKEFQDPNEIIPWVNGFEKLDAHILISDIRKVKYKKLIHPEVEVSE